MGGHRDNPAGIRRARRLKGERAGSHSIRVNQQWRICFRWTAVREIYAAAHVAGVAYSTRAPTGEWSSAIALADLAPLSSTEFEVARAADWLRP
jgi:hypothetical protein